MLNEYACREARRAAVTARRPNAIASAATEAAKLAARARVSGALLETAMSTPTSAPPEGADG